jgi:TrmH family RNA methyltransferase
MTDQERYHRARRDPALVVIEGFHALKHALRFGARVIDVATDSAADLEALSCGLAEDTWARLSGIGVLREVAPGVLAGLTPALHPTRVVALAERPPVDPAGILCDVMPPPPNVSGRASYIVLLDDPRHAGNIGAAVRVAAAAGALGLFVTGSVDPWHASAVRGGAGLQFALPVARLDSVPETARAIIAIDPEGVERGHGAAITDGSILMFGSERSGISRALLDRAERRVRIPMRDGVSSLNLATSVAVMLYHGDT